MYALLLGCAADQLSQDWQVDRLRVLAVAADPAEPRPGDTVRFDALIVSPLQPLGGSAWFACEASASTDFGCDVDPELLQPLEGAEVEPAALAELGFIGLLPDLPPAWRVPNDYLADLDETAQLEGSFGMIFILAFPDEAEPAEDEWEAAYKRVPVSLAPTPNHNPQVVGFTVGGYAVAPGGVVRLAPGEGYALSYELADDAVETYTYRNAAGVDESRTEEPYASWYLEEGEFDQPDVLWPYTEVRFSAPGEPTRSRQRVWVVVRDRRGGMGWASFDVDYGG
jgi:hypothetical protein